MDASSLEKILAIADGFRALSPADAATKIEDFVTQIRRFDSGDADRHAWLLMVAGIALAAANQLTGAAR